MLRRAWTAAALSFALPLAAAIFGNLRGVVHDPQHRPIQGATVEVRARLSSWQAQTETNADGGFELDAVPLGEYTVSVQAKGFAHETQQVTVTSASSPVLHFRLKLAPVAQTVEVSAGPEVVNPQSSATQSLIDRKQIAETAGADATNSLAMITDFVPGAVVVHDQLHVRGGHQLSWLLDGVPIPNTNIASNVGPQLNPKDIDYLEVERGGHSAEYGDRTYAVLNAVPRTGFERNREAELVTSYGNFHATNDQFSLGGHTQRFAYYASLNGNRSDLGLMTPTSKVLHDQESGLGGFASLVYNSTPKDQLRFVTSLRKDHYQIPNSADEQAAGIRDLELESDAVADFTWARTFAPGFLLTVSPFYHQNRADFVGGPSDTPFVLDDNRSSRYAGGQASLAIGRGHHDARLGLFAFTQSDDTLFSLKAANSSGLALRQRLEPSGDLEAAFAEDRYRITPWLTLNAGIRYTHFSGLLAESKADPRVGAVIRLPGTHWLLRGFYGRYYQAPPLSTVAGPLLDLALRQGFGFLPLRGERDEQREFGLTVPFREWVLDVSNFRTRARNYFDHDVLGNSNIFLPLTIQDARLRGWEATLRAPRMARRGELHLAFSHQYAEGRGGVTGGLTNFSPPNAGWFSLDHDQRDTVSGVFSVDLPRRGWVNLSVNRGSGFLNGDGPGHLPAHTTVDFSLGKSFRESWSLKLSVLNAGNRRFLIDKSNTFGGTHYTNPRAIIFGLRFRFHY